MRAHLEIHDLFEFTDHATRATSMAGWFVQSVDLQDASGALRALDPQGAVFLGCRFADGDQQHLTTRGALVFPALPGLPFDAYRSTLYRAEELFGPPHTDGPGPPDAATRPRYEDSLDGVVYAWFRGLGQVPDVAGELAMTLHDHAVTDGLEELAVNRSAVVGIMGGHAVARGTDAYAAAAGLARALTRNGWTVLTGGGPGAMEAANLGATLAGHPDHALPRALDHLATVPSFRPSIEDWAAAAFEVSQQWPAGTAGRSIGVPTWFYGHEPPNVFATQIAKYFSNALREDALLHRCGGGIIVLPGAAGTTQEVFQATTANYYATDPDEVTPLVLVDADHWQQNLPAWPLLQALGRGRLMEGAIHLVDTVEDALGRFPRR